MPYRTVEHTADVGLEIESESAQALFAEAAEAFRALTAGATEGAPVAHHHEMTLTAPDLAGLLVVWLNELLFLWDARGHAVRQIAALTITTAPTPRLEAVVALDFVPAGAGLGDDIKGVTYHDLRLERRADGVFFARILFDV